MTKEFFYEQLIESVKQSKEIDFIDRYYLNGKPYIIDDDDNYYIIRKKIADKFEISFLDVFIVGSSKFGFSPYKFTDFTYESDVDILITNNDLFDAYLWNVSNNLYNSSTKSFADDIIKLNEFTRYLAKGWLRPDKVPYRMRSSLNMNDWFDFFNSLSSEIEETNNYKINAALFKNINYARRYYVTSLKAAQYNFKK